MSFWNWIRGIHNYKKFYQNVWKQMNILTFAAWICDLSEGVVTCVALATDHPGPALALACLWVTWTWKGTHRVAVTWQACVRAPRTVMKLLNKTHTQKHRVCISRHTDQTQSDEYKMSRTKIVSAIISPCTLGQDLYNDTKGTRV